MEGSESHDKIHVKKLVALFICFFAYLFVGAVMFHHLETDNENEVRAQLMLTKATFLSENPCLGEEMLEELVKVTVNTVSSGIDPLRNASSPSNWDYASAFFFSGTVVTTIGYGKVVPKTDLGRNVCLLYALFGIPFTGWLLSTVGKFYESSFQNIARSIEEFLRNRIGFKQRRFRKTMLYMVVFIISYCLFVLVPSSWFYIMENWSFEEAHYYSFITLSTIGFGDYVASVDSHHPRNQNLLWLYDIAVACWYVFGLSYLAIVITVVGKKQKHTITKLRTMSFPSGKNDPEPPAGFALSNADVIVADETSFNKENGCTCKHHPCIPNGMSFKSEGTQTD